jgi:hypothetical protein
MTSSIPPQNDHVRGEFPAQHPTESNVGAGGIVVCGGSVGGSHSSGSAVGIHEHTPADSQSAPVSKSLQNENVLGEYPVQHPSSTYVGAGGAVVVVGWHSDGSSVSSQSQFGAPEHDRSSSKLKQNAPYTPSP